MAYEVGARGASGASPCAMLCTRPKLRADLSSAGRLRELRAPIQGRRVFSHTRLLVGDPGLEPGTSSLSERRSNRLS
jgi:hypothetical protein